MKWLGGVLMALNQLLNAATGGNPDEAFSSRVGHMRERGSRTGIILCGVLDTLDPRDGDGPHGDHCDISMTVHRERTKRELERLERLEQSEKDQ